MAGKSSRSCGVSTHSPARGLTMYGWEKLTELWSFNSQPRKGADVYRTASQKERYVSTHSPARGLTEKDGETWIREVFQLTAPQGG